MWLKGYQNTLVCYLFNANYVRIKYGYAKKSYDYNLKFHVGARLIAPLHEISPHRVIAHLPKQSDFSGINSYTCHASNIPCPSPKPKLIPPP